MNQFPHRVSSINESRENSNIVKGARRIPEIIRIVTICGKKQKLEMHPYAVESILPPVFLYIRIDKL